MNKRFAYMMAVLLATGIIAVTGFGDISSAEEADFAMPEVRTIALPITENSDTGATIADGFVYYLGQAGVVYQAPLNDPAETKPVYQINSDDGLPAAWLTTINGTAILKYHIGSATMGIDYAVALHSDGSYEDLPGSFTNFVKTEKGTVVLASDNRNLDFHIRKTNETRDTPLGESGYRYGFYSLTDGQTTAYMSSSDLTVVGDEVYVVAVKWNDPEKVTDPVGIYQVNINTNETKRVFTETATHFKTADGNIYFTDLDGVLYKAKLGTNQATKVSDIKMNEFFIIGDDIYYTPYRALNGEWLDQVLYKLGSSEPLISGHILEYAPFDANMSNGYLASILYELGSYPLKFKGLVIDESGEYVLLNADDIQYVTVYGGVIYEVVRAQDNIKLNIDGRQVSFSKTDGLGVPFIQYDRTMVPLRKPLEAIGASVNYDSANRTVTIKKDDTEISVIVDGGMFVNGSTYRQIDAPAVIKEDRVYVPIRPVFEVLGYSLSWDAQTKTVNIKKSGLPIETVKGWSVPSPAAGALGLGMSDYIGVLTEFPASDQTINLKNREQIDQLKTVGIGLRNFSSNEPVWLNSLTFEYQVYKKVNGKEELVYRKEFLPFEGILPAQSGSSTELKVDFWNPETTAPGEYTIKLAYPEFFSGKDRNSNEEVKIPINKNIFGEMIVINVNK